ncbi:GNAT family N-acetyltransferase [Robiginitalea sp. SC105]|uniref:GNAT family N-acetyltransferase n=1 Tax=Robiginitalea sp. SC105 TaxID=2762332 RepID=UPI00163A8934|nr:GNAT family N-acetyltransferase [Robiginitalea sp. SC105]MBC2840318.1 GNAT family N-acetyltransferase [Robiginitalea sp. SC105]
MHSLALQYVPDYFRVEITDDPDYLRDQVFRTKGYCLELGDLGSAENYLKENFKPNFRTSLRRRIKGLEACFNVTYQMYCGPMDPGVYNSLMDSLHQMIVRRFNQRNDRHMALQNWEAYRDSAYDLICEQNASLFVIYDDQTPIQIALNFHVGPVLFLSIPSYDIDYARFGLGNIAIYKILEWCYEHEFCLLDMGFGAFDYKLKWCNGSYSFHHSYFYRKSSPRAWLGVQFAKTRTRLINYLLRRRLNIAYHRVRDWLFGSSESDLREFLEIPGSLSPEKMVGSPLVDPWGDPAVAFLKKPAIDFLYTQREHKSNLMIYEVAAGKRYGLRGSGSEALIELQD